jgi:hypothetical protein
MDEPIEELYFNWLYHKVASLNAPKTPSNSFTTLIKELHSTEFVWILPMDDNRANDGLELRVDFLTEFDMDQDPLWSGYPCSVLEMLYAFSKRASFQTETTTRDWFWIFLNNLGLADLSDSCVGISLLVGDVLDEFVWRLYTDKGHGGVCPLEATLNDQRQVELWHQLCEYIIENDVY